MVSELCRYEVRQSAEKVRVNKQLLFLRCRLQQSLERFLFAPR